MEVSVRFMVGTDGRGPQIQKREDESASLRKALA